MTEAEWLASNELTPMISLIRRKIRRRKARLFAAACCRHIWDLLPAKKYQTMLEIAELCIEKQATEKAMLAARGELPKEKPETAGFAALAVWAAAAAVLASPDTIWWAVVAATRVVHALEESGGCPSILRDIVGNPFRPPQLDPTCRTSTVVTLARAAYDDRHLPSGEMDPFRLAVLADALEEAGASADLAAHLRGPGPHVRGCFAVDLSLGLS